MNYFFINEIFPLIGSLPLPLVFIFQPKSSNVKEYLKQWMGAIFPGIPYFNLFIHYQWTSTEILDYQEMIRC